MEIQASPVHRKADRTTRRRAIQCPVRRPNRPRYQGPEREDQRHRCWRQGTAFFAADGRWRNVEFGGEPWSGRVRFTGRGVLSRYLVVSFTRILTSVSPSCTQGRSRVREFRLHGLRRGAVSNDRPRFTLRSSLRDPLRKWGTYQERELSEVVMEDLFRDRYEPWPRVPRSSP